MLIGNFNEKIWKNKFGEPNKRKNREVEGGKFKFLLLFLNNHKLLIRKNHKMTRYNMLLFCRFFVVGNRL